MIRLFALLAALSLLGGCLPLATWGVIAGASAGATTTMINAPQVWDEVQGWVDPSALILPPQPVAVTP